MEETTLRKGQPRAPGSQRADTRPKDWLAPAALVTLRKESSHGYKLMERVRGLGFGEMNSGTLYRTPRRLEREGLCEPDWDTSADGPARRVYSVTNFGEAYLDSWAEGCGHSRRVVDSFFRAYACK